MQGLRPRLLFWQVGSLPLSQVGSPHISGYYSIYQNTHTLSPPLFRIWLLCENLSPVSLVFLPFCGHSLSSISMTLNLLNFESTLSRFSSVLSPILEKRWQSQFLSFIKASRALFIIWPYFGSPALICCWSGGSSSLFSCFSQIDQGCFPVNTCCYFWFLPFQVHQAACLISCFFTHTDVNNFQVLWLRICLNFDTFPPSFAVYALHGILVTFSIFGEIYNLCCHHWYLPQSIDTSSLSLCTLSILPVLTVSVLYHMQTFGCVNCVR